MLCILTPLRFGLSFLSGVLGPGVAFIAVPALGLFVIRTLARGARCEVRIVATGRPFEVPDAW